MVVNEDHWHMVVSGKHQSFMLRLRKSLAQCDEEAWVKGVWLLVPGKFLECIEWASREGFDIHHLEGQARHMYLGKHHGSACHPNSKTQIWSNQMIVNKECEFSFGGKNISRAMSKPDSANFPGPGDYSTQSSVGVQLDSLHPTEPKIGIGTVSNPLCCLSVGVCAQPAG
jgi:hypothetical protein